MGPGHSSLIHAINQEMNFALETTQPYQTSSKLEDGGIQLVGVVNPNSNKNLEMSFETTQKQRNIFESSGLLDHGEAPRTSKPELQPQEQEDPILAKISLSAMPSPKKRANKEVTSQIGRKK